jgi:hypothetical protein
VTQNQHLAKEWGLGAVGRQKCGSEDKEMKNGWSVSK